MAAYKASFFGANYIPMNCTSDDCDHVFLTDDIDIESSMVKFKDDAAKDRFYKIMSGERVGDYSKPEFIMLTDNIAVTLREPSIYNTVFENTVLDQKFVQKYESRKKGMFRQREKHGDKKVLIYSETKVIIVGTKSN